jgi:hypothetical protein
MSLLRENGLDSPKPRHWSAQKRPGGQSPAKNLVDLDSLFVPPPPPAAAVALPSTAKKQSDVACHVALPWGVMPKQWRNNITL